MQLTGIQERNKWVCTSQYHMQIYMLDKGLKGFRKKYNNLTHEEKSQVFL